ncbi:ribonuclease E/G [Pseudovibrio sp. Tun.PSC04-5.I4]|uniref:Rne/Rng family ribonuclease n=1 Tax=Pseudovibrio sp. Tun.PSC04-5.I4 TaxID=1798213 RepID=UPI00088A7EEC|nr:ribonuclease E/G [Pseudovibrio sp. Tun.PSC04-5.I4]SDR09168.1 RNAse E [Pseudovibrio sp. Tun.PSC04-5.I4]
MANKMLIDATHPEETRVTVVRGNRVEEFDFEAANRKQLRGNIYLAKVTRVEPSLQAAFVEYGGNRHGFLAFSEIHPDYYQLPKEDREALEAQLAAEAASNQRERDRREREEAKREAAIQKAAAAKAAEASEDVVAELIEAETSALEAEHEAEALANMDAPFQDDSVEDIQEDASDEATPAKTTAVKTVAPAVKAEAVANTEEPDQFESVGNEDAQEELPERPRRLRDNYKIQEVIKRRQLLLVQVVKEERGNKGAALTTYLSLAGRYSVLMPNTDRGGGISRKITKPTDRKRLKQVAGDLDVPNGMGVILRTAGASRTKAEIKRDFEYLLRLWENVRELTLDSAAPTLVYEEGSLIKRSIRDLYNKDIDQVMVAGEEGYREAKDFMRMLMPSHSKNVQPYREATPIFTRFGVEAQLDAMFSPQVTLKSGGYIVINQTEALVAIDVNSGKATREQNIEDTAQATNLEAAEEIARQLRLRDLAGLVVIDFIDMEENRNNRAVERRLKECLKSDRARIQVGRISHFGLLEMSRQRIRTGVLESSSVVCPHCHGSGIVRSVESVALHILRSLEDQLLRGSSHNLSLNTPNEVAMYILNQKRHHLMDLERRFGLEITILGDDTVTDLHFTLERGELATPSERTQPLSATVQPDTIYPAEEEEEDEIEEVEDEIVENQAEIVEIVEDKKSEDEDDEDGNDRRRRRRRRRRRTSNDRNETEQKDEPEATEEQPATEEAASEETVAEGPTAEELEDEEDRRRKRRRGRRGGRRSRRRNPDEENAEGSDESEDNADDQEAETPKAAAAEETPAEVTKAEAPAPVTPSETPVAVVEPAPEKTAAPAPEVQVEKAPVKATQPEKKQEEAPAKPAVESKPVAPIEAPKPTAEPVKVSAPEPVAEPVKAAAPEPKKEAPATVQDDAEVITQKAPANPETSTKPVVTSHKVVKGETVAVKGEEESPRRTGWWQRRSFF